MMRLSVSFAWVLPILAVCGAYCWHFYGSKCVCTSQADLTNKTVIVTGANSGIGWWTALSLARRGARVILACRNLQKAEDAAKEIGTKTGNSEVVARHLDLASLQSVREFANMIVESENRLDILINNAGVAFIQTPQVRTTEENFDYVFGINHFGHFVLTNLLLDHLRKSAPSRVITVSSALHHYAQELNLTRSVSGVEVWYPHLQGYSVSKTANILFARELARRQASSGVVSVSLHPGAINSCMVKNHMTAESQPDLVATLYYVVSPLMWLVLMDEEAGTQTTLHCALDESVTALSGSYFDNCQVGAPSALAQDDELARKLWEVSCEATGSGC